jgi:isochorismate synthase
MTTRRAATADPVAPAHGRRTSAPAPAAGAPTAIDLGASLLPLVRRALRRDEPTLVSCTTVLPATDPVDLFAAAFALGHEPRIWLAPGDRFALVGIGAAHEIRATGPGRFREAAGAWTEILRGAEVADGGVRTRGTGPVLLGGFPFMAGPSMSMPADPAGPWTSFESGSLVLPRLLVTAAGEDVCLTANVLVPPGPAKDREAAATATIARLGATWTAVVDGARTHVPLMPVATDLVETTAVSDGAEAAWDAAVIRLAGAVGRGRVDKVVLARRVDLVADGPIDVPVVLRRLEASGPESTIFAVTRGERTFLGATPERLVRSEGHEFRTMALAGSIRRGADDAEDARLAADLSASEKEREEHRVVVEMLRDTLAPLAVRLDIDPEPGVVRLRHIQHLMTTITGRTREQAGILDLVERLHPTPAVGGAPRELALALLQEEEHLDRGWYAGPLGWLDRESDGEFVVAIRSGVVTGPRASLFVGCGIVADSEPDREWEESRVKLRALASAIGRPT